MNSIIQFKTIRNIFIILFFIKLKRQSIGFQYIRNNLCIKNNNADCKIKLNTLEK